MSRRKITASTGDGKKDYEVGMASPRRIPSSTRTVGLPGRAP